MQTRELLRHLVPIEDAQQELGGISRTTLYKLFDEGHLVRARIGRRAFVTGDSIAAYINHITQGD
ncbi:helix-turn-helix domain-containing protein [Mycolicibacterium sp. HS_4_1]